MMERDVGRVRIHSRELVRGMSGKALCCHIGRPAVIVNPAGSNCAARLKLRPKCNQQQLYRKDGGNATRLCRTSQVLTCLFLNELDVSSTTAVPLARMYRTGTWKSCSTPSSILVPQTAGILQQQCVAAAVDCTHCGSRNTSCNSSLSRRESQLFRIPQYHTHIHTGKLA